jgi:translocator protein
VSIRSLLATAAAVFVTSAVGGLASRRAVPSDWYKRLRKPVYQPPSPVFSWVWTTLYADIATVSANTLKQLRDNADDRARRSYLAALSVNLFLNASWPWVFFNRHWLGSSTVLAAALTASSADLSGRAIAVRGAYAAPLVAYPLWCGFATLLSGHIWLLNRSRSGKESL